MNTTIAVALFCTVLYAGIGAITNTTSEINHHNNQLNNAVLAMESQK